MINNSRNNNTDPQTNLSKQINRIQGTISYIMSLRMRESMENTRSMIQMLLMIINRIMEVKITNRNTDMMMRARI